MGEFRGRTPHFLERHVYEERDWEMRGPSPEFMFHRPRETIAPGGGG